jgi:hypothetical protein
MDSQMPLLRHLTMFSPWEGMNFGQNIWDKIELPRGNKDQKKKAQRCIITTSNRNICNQEWIKHLDSCNLTLNLMSDLFLSNSKMWNVFFLFYWINKYIHTHFNPQKGHMTREYRNPIHLPKRLIFNTWTLTWWLFMNGNIPSLDRWINEKYYILIWGYIKKQYMYLHNLTTWCKLHYICE